MLIGLALPSHRPSGMSVKLLFYASVVQRAVQRDSLAPLVTLYIKYVYNVMYVYVGVY